MSFRWLLALAMFASPSVAATTSPATQALLRATLDEAALQTPAGREALVKTAQAYCEEVKAAYPTNSPAEEQWLTNEFRGEGERLMRAVSSAELGRRQAKFFTDTCLTWTAELSKNPDKSKSFVVLAYAFIRFSRDTEMYARKNSVDPDKFGLMILPKSVTEALLIASLSAAQP